MCMSTWSFRDSHAIPTPPLTSLPLPPSAVEASDPQASLKRLFWDESLHYVGPGIPSHRPKGASPRVHWMVPYEERGLHETRLVVRNAASAKATVVEVDLAATQDHALLQRMMGKG